VATGSFQPGIGGVGINPLVNTQFQYLDVGVNVDITPHVHADNSITLKVMLDISAVDTTTNIGGINQPVIGQRKVEHEIRLKAGEVNILGGIMDQRDTRSLTGYPWLSQIPILKYFFSQNTREHLDDETVFVLVPHIVRAQDVDVMNARVVDVGTANAISLRPTAQLQGSQAPAGAAVPGQPGAPAQPGAQPAPGQPAPAQQPPANQPSTPPQQQASAQPPPDQGGAPAGAATLTFDPTSINQAAGSTFTVNVMLSGAQNVYSVPVQISYNPNVLQLLNVSNGSLLSKDGQAVALVHREDTSTGMIQVTATRPPNSGGVSGQGDVFTLTFMARAPGTSTLSIVRDGIRDAAMQMIQASAGQATVSVH
jgi:general secretion pathway protein D